MQCSKNFKYKKKKKTGKSIFLHSIKIFFFLGVPGQLSWLSVLPLISAQVMISRFMGSSPMLDSLLIVRSLLGILSSSLSPPPLLALSFSLSLKINKLKKIKSKTSIFFFFFLFVSRFFFNSTYLTSSVILVSGEFSDSSLTYNTQCSS